MYVDSQLKASTTPLQALPLNLLLLFISMGPL